MEENKVKIWFDITNTPHVNFLFPLIDHLHKYNNIEITSRDFSETVFLLNESGFKHTVVDNHRGSSKLLKFSGMLNRTIALLNKLSLKKLK